MTQITKVALIHPSYPFAGRAAQREIVRGLNFTITNLMSAVIREQARMALVPIVNPSPSSIENPYAGIEEDEPDVNVGPLLQKYGPQHTLDQRNDEDLSKEGEKVSNALHEERGLEPVKEDPRILAGKLKVIRDAFAFNLDKYAKPIPNPLGKRGETYLNPYEIAEPILVTLAKQMARPVTVNRDILRAQAEALDLDPVDLERIQIRQQQAGLKFLKENKKELLAIFAELEAYRPGLGMEGDLNHDAPKHDDERYEATLEAIDDLELEIPAIHRARMYINAERGYFYERDRWITAMVKRHPEAAVHLKIIEGCRVYAHKEFNSLMDNPKFYDEINREVLNGATWPTMMDLPKKATEETTSATG